MPAAAIRTAPPSFYSHAHTGVISMTFSAVPLPPFLLTRPYGRDPFVADVDAFDSGFYSHAHTGVILFNLHVDILQNVSTHTPIRA